MPELDYSFPVYTVTFCSNAGYHLSDVPEPPEIIDIFCNERHASIKWKAAYDNADPVTQYIVEYSTAFHPGRWRISLTEENVKNVKFEAVMSLSPWVNYTFRVLAINGHGKSEPGYKKTRCNTAPSYPYINPINVTGEGDNKDNLVIFWQVRYCNISCMAL